MTQEDAGPAVASLTRIREGRTEVAYICRHADAIPCEAQDKTSLQGRMVAELSPLVPVSLRTTMTF